MMHILNTKPFGVFFFFSECERFADIYTSVKSTKVKFIPIGDGMTSLIRKSIGFPRVVGKKLDKCN